MKNEFTNCARIMRDDEIVGLHGEVIICVPNEIVVFSPFFVHFERFDRYHMFVRQPFHTGQTSLKLLNFQRVKSSN